MTSFTYSNQFVLQLSVVVHKLCNKQIHNDLIENNHSQKLSLTVYDISENYKLVIN